MPTSLQKALKSSWQLCWRWPAIPLLGFFAFLADQRRRSFRFLADRGVPPKYVWLSRQLTALGASPVAGHCRTVRRVLPAVRLLATILPARYSAMVRRRDVRKSIPCRSLDPFRSRLRGPWPYGRAIVFDVLSQRHSCRPFQRALERVSSGMVWADVALAGQLAVVNAADPVGPVARLSDWHGRLAHGAEHAAGLVVAGSRAGGSRRGNLNDRAAVPRL